MSEQTIPQLKYRRCANFIKKAEWLREIVVMKSRTRTVITLETWQKTTVRIARNPVSTNEPPLDCRGSYRIVAPADDPLLRASGAPERKSRSK